MIRVNIVNLKSGMVLAKPVKNRQGVLLLGAAAKITKKNVHIFKTWGINEFWVEGELDISGDAVGISVPVNKDPIDIELRAKFSDVLNDPVMVEIFKAARRQLMEYRPTNEDQKEKAETTKNHRRY